MNQGTCGKILHVDDDPDILWMFEMILEDEGFDVVTTESPLNALDLCHETVFDVAILDYSMDEMTGDVLALRLWELNPGLEVIFVSGHSDFVSRLSLEIPAALVMMKPVSNVDLVEAVSSRIRHDRGDVVLDVPVVPLEMHSN